MFPVVFQLQYLLDALIKCCIVVNKYGDYLLQGAHVQHLMWLKTYSFLQFLRLGVNCLGHYSDSLICLCYNHSIKELPNYWWKCYHCCAQ